MYTVLTHTYLTAWDTISYVEEGNLRQSKPTEATRKITSTGKTHN